MEIPKPSRSTRIVDVPASESLFSAENSIFWRPRKYGNLEAARTPPHKHKKMLEFAYEKQRFRTV